MSAEIFKFPYGARLRVHSHKPRRSKNRRRLKTIDRRKLRGSPLRDKVPVISFAVTISGKMHTAALRGEPMPHDAAGWLEELHTGASTARYVADELRLDQRNGIVRDRVEGESIGGGVRSRGEG